MSLVEKVALDIGELGFLLDFATEDLEDIARIALSAIRVPTVAMIVAGHNLRIDPSYSVDEIYTAMIDAGLAE
jgi:hypothetical protein